MTALMLTNPILPGFHPDPAFCVVGEDMYLATSTFEWWPGVMIYHSRDLRHWRVASRPLQRLSQLDLRGVPDSGGVWAPCLTHAHGLFWLVYTNTHELNSAFKDCPNYVVSSPSIEGPWSEPTFLNATGFDPSLFHDTDGRSWLTTMRWNHCSGAKRFDGIVLQEFDRQQGCLVGPEHHIFAGTDLGCTEGPHLYRWGSYYYLLTAEGGTGTHHAVTIARSPTITGPYEVHPENPILTSVGAPADALQKCGHGGIVTLADGSWWLSHLCARPLPDSGRCVLGRETGLQALDMGADGWPRLAHGGRHPALTVPAPKLAEHRWPDDHCPSGSNVLEEPWFSQRMHSPRLPISDDWCQPAERPGWLRLRGGESPQSRFAQHCLAHRRQAMVAWAETCTDAQAETYQQQAALMALYDTRTWYALGVTWRPDVGRCLVLSYADDGAYDEHAAAQPLPDTGLVYLRVEADHQQLRFLWRLDEQDPWTPIGPLCDGSRLSDEYGTGWKFTGSWFAVQVMDLQGHRWWADIGHLRIGSA